MSRITKMKYVAAETTYDYTLPTAEQTICKIVKPLGNNTHMVCDPSGEEFIVSMPPKFRRHVYVRRGSYVVTEPIVEGKKVKAEIVRILQRQQIKYFHSKGAWPSSFDSNNVYLDNSHKRLEETSDRGFVHGSKVYYINKKDSDSNGRSTMLCAGKEDLSNKPEEDCDLPSDSEDDDFGIEPNFNKKAVSRIVFSDDSDESDDEEESGEDEEVSDEDEEVSGEDEKVSEGDSEEGEDDDSVEDEEESKITENEQKSHTTKVKKKINA